jgi:hypothetical protein
MRSQSMTDVTAGRAPFKLFQSIFGHLILLAFIGFYRYLMNAARGWFYWCMTAQEDWTFCPFAATLQRTIVIVAARSRNLQATRPPSKA